jgi:preprotein translocase SecE subunit
MSIINYLKETRAEMRHVTWPKINEAFGYTLIIIVLCIVLAAMLGFFDYLFAQLIQKII